MSLLETFQSHVYMTNSLNLLGLGFSSNTNLNASIECLIYIMNQSKPKNRSESVGMVFIVPGVARVLKVIGYFLGTSSRGVMRSV